MQRAVVGLVGSLKMRKSQTVSVISINTSGIQWNLDLTKCQGTGPIVSLYQGFVISKTSLERICNVISLYRGMGNNY